MTSTPVLIALMAILAIASYYLGYIIGYENGKQSTKAHPKKHFDINKFKM